MSTAAQPVPPKPPRSPPRAPESLSPTTSPTSSTLSSFSSSPKAIASRRPLRRTWSSTRSSPATFDALLLDLNYTRDTTSGREGLDLLSQIRSHESQLPVIVMTAWANVELAVEAMRRGANDFIQKPWDNARLLTILRTQIDLYNAVRRATRLEAENRLLRAARTCRR